MQEDFGRQTRTIVDVNDDRIRVRRLSTDDGESRAFTLPADPTLIVDAGFDAYIRTNMTELTQGKATLEFAIAGVQRTLKMQVSPGDSDNRSTTSFKIYPRNWFIRLFVPKIKLLYSSDRPRLLRYEGYSNLIAREGNRIVVISFDYHMTDEPLDAPNEAWLAKR